MKVHIPQLSAVMSRRQAASKHQTGFWYWICIYIGCLVAVTHQVYCLYSFVLVLHNLFH